MSGSFLGWGQATMSTSSSIALQISGIDRVFPSNHVTTNAMSRFTVAHMMTTTNNKSKNPVPCERLLQAGWTTLSEVITPRCQRPIYPMVCNLSWCRARFVGYYACFNCCQAKTCICRSELELETEWRLHVWFCQIIVRNMHSTTQWITTFCHILSISGKTNHFPGLILGKSTTTFKNCLVGGVSLHQSLGRE